MNTSAIVNTGPNELTMREMPVAEPARGEARIRTLACGVCATDLEMIAGWDRTGFPAIPGHEWCGRIESVGPGVSADLAGKIAVGDNILPDGGEIGFEHPGGYARLFVTRADNLIVLPDDTVPAQATLIEPLAVCLRAIRKVRDVLPAPALILGDGPIGLLTLLLLRHFGAKEVTVVGGRGSRLALAGSIGAARTINYHEVPDFASGKGLAVGNDSWPLIVESSGSTVALESAMALAAKDARILMLGDYGEGRAGFKWNRLLHGELHIIGSNTGSGAWREAAELAGALPLAPLVTHRFSASEFRAAIDAVRDRRSGAVKVVLEWR